MRMKALFLMPAILASLGLAAGAAILAFAGAGPGWIGTLVAAAPLPGFVLFVAIGRRTARTTATLAPLLAVSAAGSAFALLALVAADGGAAAAALAVAATAVLLWYVFSYSRFGRAPSPALAVGERLPPFPAEDLSGRTVAPDAFRGAPALFLFYRGNWCPLCMAQVGEVAAHYRRLAACGVQIVLVSPQPARETARLAERFDVPLTFLVDRNGRSARRLGILAEGGTPAGIDRMGYGTDTVMPTVVATDADGRILFADETDNYRVRPEPETFLAIFEGRTGVPAGAAA